MFFGVLAEVAGTRMKHYNDVSSLAALKLRIEDDFPEIIHYDFRISLNSEIISDKPNLKNGDEIALLPPFAGG